MIDIETKEKTTEFINASNLVFKSIDNEEFREYFFIAGERKIVVIKIHNPLWLHVSESGGHRIFDNQGMSHYIPYKWIHLGWKPKEGEVDFRF